MHSRPCRWLRRSVVGIVWLSFLLGPVHAAHSSVASASSSDGGFVPVGAINGDRFSTVAGAAWKGRAGDSRWWWQVRFDAPREVGAILQIVGDHPFVLRNAPRRYVWQRSNDGLQWIDFAETAIADE